MELTVLGGGIAGLASAYYAARQGRNYRVFEAADYAGGNARTLTHGPFRFDTGAHRFHDRIPFVTADVRHLLGPDLQRVSAPSQIYSRGSLIDFPLAPLDLLRKLGLRDCLRVGVDIAWARVRQNRGQNFETVAVRTYGRTAAQRFLLDYSEKLWGVPCRQLSPRVAGQRLTGLHVGTYVRQALLGRHAKSEHLDGQFYYPRRGIGMIAERLAAACGQERIRYRAKVTKLCHRNGRVVAVEVNGHERTGVDEIVATLPLPVVVRLLDPPAPDAVLTLATRLRFRDVRLVLLLLDRPSVSTNATVYFPDPEFLFTRVTEPRNRSAEMSPPGRTALMFEVPCWRHDAVSCMSDEELAAHCRSSVERLGWIRRDELLDVVTHRLNFAYPVIDVESEGRMNGIHAYLSRFDNLHVVGRAAQFSYSHIHDQMKVGRDVLAGLASRSPRPEAVDRTAMRAAV